MTLKALEKIDTLCVSRCDPAETGLHWSVFLAPETVVPAAAALSAAAYCLEDILALDTADGFVVIYHFNGWDFNDRVALKIQLPQTHPTLPSITSVFPGAQWHERETRDFHGIFFEGNPNFIPLLMPAEDADVYPLRKTDKARRAIRDIMNAGEVVSCTGEIERLFAPPPDPADPADPKTDRGPDA